MVVPAAATKNQQRKEKRVTRRFSKDKMEKRRWKERDGSRRKDGCDRNRTNFNWKYFLGRIMFCQLRKASIRVYICMHQTISRQIYTPPK
jgi:hypothetical protein